MNDETIHSLQNLPLKDLKAVAIKLGIKGTTSRTKYTKHNRSKLIGDILLAIKKRTSPPKVVVEEENESAVVEEEEESSESVVVEEEEEPRMFTPSTVTSVRDISPQRDTSYTEEPIEDLLTPSSLKKKKESKSTTSCGWMLGLGAVALTLLATITLYKDSDIDTSVKNKRKSTDSSPPPLVIDEI